MNDPAEDPEVTALREKWAPNWQIWRSVRSGDDKPGELVASRMSTDAGPHRTVLAPNATRLDVALTEQRDRALGVYVPKTTTSPWL